MKTRTREGTVGIKGRGECKWLTNWVGTWQQDLQTSYVHWVRGKNSEVTSLRSHLKIHPTQSHCEK